MASKNIRDVTLKVNAEDIGTAARDAAKLNKALAAMIETVKNSSRTFNSINNSMKGMAEAVKMFNKSITASKASTKGLENYRARVEETRKTLMGMRHEAENTLKTVKALNTAMDKSGGMNNMREDLLDLKDGFQRVVEELQQMNSAMKFNNIYTAEMETSLGKIAARTKEVRQSTGRSADAIGRLGENSRRAAASGDSLNQSLRGMAGQGRTTARGFSELAFKMNPLTSAYASIAINVYAAAEAFRVLNEAANLQRLISQTASFSAAVSGVNVSGLAKQMVELSAGALSLRESLSFAAKGTAFNFTTDQLEKLTVGARKASIALGRDFNDSMDRVLRGISKQEIELFDELGVVTRLTPAFEAYARTVNKSVDELSDYERQLALTNEVQKQLDQRFEGIDLYSTAWEKLGKTTQNALDTSLMALQDSLAPLAEYATSLISLVGTSTEYKQATASMAESTEILNIALRDGKENVGSALVAYGELAKTIGETEKANLASSEAVAAATDKFEKFDTALKAIAATAATYALLKLYGAVKPLVAMLPALGARSAAAGLAMLSAVAGGGLVGAIAAARTAVVALSRSLLTLLLPAMPIIIAGAAAIAGAFYLFGDELKEVSLEIAKVIPGLEEVGELMGIDTEILKNAKALDNFNEQLKELGVNVDGLTPDKVIEMGTAYQAFVRDTNEAQQQVDSLVGAIGRVDGPLQETIDLFSKFNSRTLSASIKDMPQVLEALEASFNDLKEDFKLSPEITNYDQFLDRVKDLSETLRTLDRDMSIMGTSMSLAGYSDIEIMEAKLAKVKNSLKEASKVGLPSYNKEEAERLSQMSEDLQLQIMLAKQNYALDVERLNTNTELALKRIQGTTSMYSEVDALKDKLAAEKNILNIMDDQTSTQRFKKWEQLASIALLEQEIVKTEKLFRLQEAAAAAASLATATRLQEERKAATETLGGRRQTESSKVASRIAVATAEYAAAKAEFDKVMGSDALGAERAAATIALNEAAQNLDIASWKEQAAAMRDVAVAAGEVANSVPGMSALQTEFMNTFSTVASTIANVTELTAANMDITLKDVADGITAVGTLTSNIMSELTQGMVADIDAQIAAEKRKDGKSQESLAKIRQLEAKKIKEQEKSKTAQTGMSTALAIMQAYAELGPIAGSFAAAGLAALGALQINNIKKAAAGQLAALDDSGGSNLSLTVGSRNNAVDVSQRASMGELAYLRGDQGVGSNANSFTPGRAGGGSIIVGERGPEEITPLQPINVSPNSSGASKEGTNIQIPNLNITALDSESFNEYAERNSLAFFEAMEREAEARGYSLEKLK